MSNPNCKYVLGEFSADEFDGNEFFTGFLDCSVEDSVYDCKDLLIHSRPLTRSQREIDYQLLWEYVKKDLTTSATSIFGKAEIGINDDLGLEFNVQTSYLISLILLFKEQLKAKKKSVEDGEGTIEEKELLVLNIYSSLFQAYKFVCINNNFKARYKKPKYIREMFKILNIQDLVTWNLVSYQMNTDYNSDPIYYIADLT